MNPLRGALLEIFREELYESVKNLVGFALTWWDIVVNERPDEMLAWSLAPCACGAVRYWSLSRKSIGCPACGRRFFLVSGNSISSTTDGEPTDPH
jgi:hypothetical protein